MKDPECDIKRAKFYGLSTDVHDVYVYPGGKKISWWCRDCDPDTCVGCAATFEGISRTND